MDSLETEIWKENKQETAYHKFDQRLNDHDALMKQLEARIEQEVGNSEKADGHIK